MKKLLGILVLGLFLSSCGTEDPDKKRRKAMCNMAGFEKGPRYEECIKNAESAFLYTLDFAVDEKIKTIEEYNLKVEKLNKIDMGIDKDEYEKVGLDSFISREFVKVEKGIGMKIRPNAERKKIKFNTYFEIYETDQGSKSFAISFDSYAKYMMFSDDSVKDRLLTKGIFQNIEIERKIMDELVGGYSYQLATSVFKVPIGDAQSTFYGYFLNKENEVAKTLSKVDPLYFWFDTPFYIEDIELKKVSTDKSNIQEFLVNEHKWWMKLSAK